ncbi:uncharacterized protein PAE49_002177 [Odontesthes bonariensis]|uniref:uncharacterized protein LOC142375206 n=1 Tax=Odontesthes bonariensis TaxID=219752 RepID=UPI003F58F7C9
MMQALGEEHLVGTLPRPTGLGVVRERPAAEGFPELPRIIDEDDGNSLASYVSSDDENELRGPIGVVFNDVDVPDFSFCEEADDVLENRGIVHDEEDSDTESCTSEGSVYSFSEGEVSWFDLEESDAEDSDSSASGPGTSRKRSREESEESQSDAKRPRKSCEESFGEEQFSGKPPPSTSGLSFLQSEGWDPSRHGGSCEATHLTSGLDYCVECFVDLIVKRARWDDSSSFKL